MAWYLHYIARVWLDTYITLLGYGMIPTLHCSGMAWYLHYIRHKKSYLFTNIASNHDINTRYNNRLPTRLWLRLLSQFPLIFHYYINFHLLDSYVNCYCCSTVISIAIDTWQLYQFPFWYLTISISVQLLYQFLLIFDCYINFLWYSTIIWISTDIQLCYQSLLTHHILRQIKLHH